MYKARQRNKNTWKRKQLWGRVKTKRAKITKMHQIAQVRKSNGIFQPCILTGIQRIHFGTYLHYLSLPKRYLLMISQLPRKSQQVLEFFHADRSAIAKVERKIIIQIPKALYITNLSSIFQYQLISAPARYMLIIIRRYVL